MVIVDFERVVGECLLVIEWQPRCFNWSCGLADYDSTVLLRLAIQSQFDLHIHLHHPQRSIDHPRQSRIYHHQNHYLLNLLYLLLRHQYHLHQSSQRHLLIPFRQWATRCHNPLKCLRSIHHRLHSAHIVHLQPQLLGSIVAFALYHCSCQ